MFCKKGVLRNFGKFTGKHLCQRLFKNKVAGMASDHRNEVFKIYVQFDENSAGLMKIKTDLLAKRHCWIPIDKTESKIKVELNKDTSPVIQSTQFPLMLSWGCTSHKVHAYHIKCKG